MILVIILIVAAVIVVVMIRLVKENRKRKMAAARTANMEMAIMTAVRQLVSEPREEQPPSHREVVAGSDAGRTKPSNGGNMPAVLMMKSGVYQSPNRL